MPDPDTANRPAAQAIVYPPPFAGDDVPAGRPPIRRPLRFVQAATVALVAVLGAFASPAIAGPPSGELGARSAGVGRGGTLDGALRRAGVEGETLGLVLDAAARSLDLRRLPPRTGVRATFDAAGRPLSVTVRDAPERMLRITLPDRIELLQLPVITSVETAIGTVESSVAQALSDEPHGMLLTLAFSDVMQWDVDLLVDPRPGDEVRVVYRRRRLGAVPDDLPRFGDAPIAEGETLGPGRILAAAYRGAEASAEAYWVSTGTGDDYFDAAGRPLRKTFLKSPLNYRRISSRFSNARRNPVTRKVVPHHGIDFAADTGTPVVATADGRVVAAGWDGALGRSVRLRHGSEWVTIYGHLSRIARGVRPGAEVAQNEVIGYVGSTGRATGPHLHYTVLHRGTAIDPMKMDNPPGRPLDESLRPRLDQAVRRWRAALGDSPTAIAAQDVRLSRPRPPADRRPGAASPG